MNIEFWKTQTHALVLYSVYSSMVVGEVYEINRVNNAGLVSLYGSPNSYALPFRLNEIAPVSSLVRELL
jgi:hypothetical protein